jgi:hypothetical protein
MKKIILMILLLNTIINVYSNERIFRHFINYFFDVKDDFNNNSEIKFNKSFYSWKLYKDKRKTDDLFYFIKNDSEEILVQKSMSDMLVIYNSSEYDYNIIGIKSWLIGDAFGEEEENIDKVYDFYIITIEDNIVSMKIFIPQYEIIYNDNEVIINLIDLRFRDLYNTLTIHCVTNMGHWDIYDINNLNKINFTDLYFNRDYNSNKPRRIENVVIKAVGLKIKK